MEEVPKELDWVNERANSDIIRAFERLEQAVKNDVERYKTLSGSLQSHNPIEFKNEQNSLFSVGRRSHLIRFTVFHRMHDCIEINIHSSADEQTLKATPVLTETGDCKFCIEGEKGEPLFQWQLRRRFLEPILFGNQ